VVSSASLARRQTALRACQNLIVANAQGLDPPLLAQRQPDEEAQLDQLGVGEMLVQLLP
jgi:hypothetical protein